MSKILILRLSIKQRAIMVIMSCFFLILFFLLGYYFSQTNHFIFVGNSQPKPSINFNSVQSNLTPAKTEQGNCLTSEQYDLLQKENTILKSDIQLERKTQTLLKQQLAKHTAKITQLKTEVSLYKGIITDSDKSAGVYFQRISFKIADKKLQKEFNKEKNSHLFQYSITIAKKNKSKMPQKGRVQLTLFDHAGKNNNKLKLLDLKGEVTAKLHAQFQNLIIKEGLLLIDKQQSTSDKKNAIIGKIKVSYIDSIKGDLDINHQFDLAIDKDISYVGK
jgi:hypothetical protein